MSGNISMNSMNESLAYDWTREATSYLIQIYEAYPILYYPKSPDYHNRRKKANAHEEVAVKFNARFNCNLSSDFIKRKVHALRSHYMGEINKMKKSEASGPLTMYKPKWWCFNKLHFFKNGPAITPGTSKMEHVEFEEVQPLEFHLTNEFDRDLLAESEHNQLSPTSSVHDFHSDTPSSVTSIGNKKRKVQHENIHSFLSSTQEQQKEVGREGAFLTWVGVELAKIRNEEIVDEIVRKITQVVFDGRQKDKDGWRI